ncbi:MAG: 2OG-Fe(II) oxygenase [Reyranella sp.]|uniref:2OG-Fe(II) oxygenase n=1 Tax=Reyranella sp. TaxID=1929291 RepID=UPI002730A531|nr:2OG-Fe(II) oxygenase [Reyranella sp.]MDP1965584.1 2OG-Fe(II) oxygenase [Reyranella sp.]MDP2376160.1 2OG-Fe(II) oxygenase [Reyranella sp.]
MSAPSFLAGQFLPHRIFHGWLGERAAARLLAYSLAAEGRFTPTKLNDHGTGRLDAVIRQSSVLKDLGAFAGPLRRKALCLQDGLETAFNMQHTPANSTQMEMVAHGDGAFYRPHTDTYTGDEYTPGGRRRLTMVYYLHRRPCRFTGGRLRLFDRGGEQSIEIEPTHDSLLVFPSSALHEVETISCPGGDFADGRFAVNIWLCG